jgi:N-acetyl-anhydromuramyl-L-alanine amidase AmpD
MRRLVACLALIVLGASPALAQKPPVSFVPANPRFYARGRAGHAIRYVVIHTIEGSASSGMNTFRSGRRRVSAHYIVDFNGRITQMVHDQDTAWHAGNSLYNHEAIGIEHAGYSGRNKWTMDQYRASARLTRWLCDTYHIPIDRHHIIGHVEVPHATHGDPGRYFDWDLYMRLVRGDAATTSDENAAPVVATVRPAQGEVMGASDVTGGLRVDWSARGSTQKGARVLLEEVGGALRYDSGYLPGASTSHRVTAALKDDRTYRWKVRVTDGDDVVETPWVTFKTDLNGAHIVVLAPLNGATVDATPGLQWKVEDGRATQVSYRIWLDDDADHTHVIGDTKELNGPNLEYDLKAHLKPSKTYYWRVMSYDGRNAATSAWMSFTTSSRFVDASTGRLNVVALGPTLGASVVPGDRPTLRWAYNSPDRRPQRGFRVQVDDMADDGHVRVDEQYAADVTGYRLATVLPPGRYRWRVRVSDGTTTAETPWQAFVVPAPTVGMTDLVPR